MKHFQKGFGLSFVLIIVAFVLAAGVAYLYQQNLNKSVSTVESGNPSATGTGQEVTTNVKNSTVTNIPVKLTFKLASPDDSEVYQVFAQYFATKDKNATFAKVDLNDDGLSDVIEYTEDSYNCGAAKCGMEIYIQSPKGQWASASSGFLISGEVSVLPHITNGFHDIAIRTNDVQTALIQRDSTGYHFVDKQSSVSVPGMSKYTDSDFSWQVTGAGTVSLHVGGTAGMSYSIGTFTDCSPVDPPYPPAVPNEISRKICYNGGAPSILLNVVLENGHYIVKQTNVVLTGNANNPVSLGIPKVLFEVK